MSASQVVVGIAITVMGLWGLVLLPRVWRGKFSRPAPRFRGRDRTQGELAYMWWPFGDATRRGVIRGLAPLTFAVWGIVLGYWVALAPSRPGPLSPATRAVVGLAIAWFGVCCVLLVTVIYFNWPKFVVPPTQRTEPGAIAEWRTSCVRSQRRRTRS